MRIYNKPFIGNKQLLSYCRDHFFPINVMQKSLQIFIFINIWHFGLLNFVSKYILFMCYMMHFSYAYSIYLTQGSSILQ